jgi:hypothetical protein
MSFHVPNQFRLRKGAFKSNDDYGNNGAFFVKLKQGQCLNIIASDEGLENGEKWEHVSVSRHDRCPLWAEMCEVKDMFWDAEDCVIQYHPPRSKYIDCHPHTLHLWRKVGSEFEMPPGIMVGIKSLTPDDFNQYHVISHHIKL